MFRDFFSNNRLDSGKRPLRSIPRAPGRRLGEGYEKGRGRGVDQSGETGKVLLISSALLL